VSSGQKQLKGGHQARVHSDEMFLVVVRREAGPARLPKMLR
jgi:hypothetical protein